MVLITTLVSQSTVCWQNATLLLLGWVNLLLQVLLLCQRHNGGFFFVQHKLWVLDRLKRRLQRREIHIAHKFVGSRSATHAFLLPTHFGLKAHHIKPGREKSGHDKASHTIVTRVEASHGADSDKRMLDGAWERTTAAASVPSSPGELAKQAGAGVQSAFLAGHRRHVIDVSIEQYLRGSTIFDQNAIFLFAAQLLSHLPSLESDPEMLFAESQESAAAIQSLERALQEGMLDRRMSRFLKIGSNESRGGWATLLPASISPPDMPGRLSPGMVDAVQDVKDHIRNEAAQRCWHEEGGAIVVVSPASSVCSVGLREFLSVVHKQRLVVVINHAFDPVPRELGARFFRPVYAIRAFEIKRRGKEEDNRSRDEIAAPSWKVCVTRAFERPWHVFVGQAGGDGDGVCWYEHIDDFEKEPGTNELLLSFSRAVERHADSEEGHQDLVS